MATILTGLFNTPAAASDSIRTLELQGFKPDSISVLASERLDREAFGVETGSKVGEGAAIGGGIGGATAALIGGLTAVGAVSTGGAGLLVAGPLVAALAGAGAGAAAGGVIGGLAGLAIPEHEVKHYEDAIEKGAVMVGVECEDSDDKDKAKQAFKQHNADKISHA